MMMTYGSSPSPSLVSIFFLLFFIFCIKLKKKKKIRCIYNHIDNFHRSIDPSISLLMILSDFHFLDRYRIPVDQGMSFFLKAMTSSFQTLIDLYNLHLLSFASLLSRGFLTSQSVPSQRAFLPSLNE